MKTEPNEPIHAAPMYNKSDLPKIEDVGIMVGLTKREHFASMAMQGILANSAHKLGPKEISEDSVKSADALIAQLNKQP